MPFKHKNTRHRKKQQFVGRKTRRNRIDGGIPPGFSPTTPYKILSNITKRLNFLDPSRYRTYEHEYRMPEKIPTPTQTITYNDREREAISKINRFITKKHPIFISKNLQEICSDSNVCIAFGTQANQIRTFFDDFNNFKLLSNSVKRIGKTSANGFVNELTYLRYGYVANTVLKSSVSRSADNLLYEALVGFFLNKMSVHFPSFLETYGLYKYKDEDVYNTLKDNTQTESILLNRGLKRIATNSQDINNSIIRSACFIPKSMSVMIQYLKGVKTLKDYIIEIIGRRLYVDSDFVENDLLYVFFQVYMTLSTLSKVFTHYDLHMENVLIYQPVEGSYIEYHYHIDGKEVIFKSSYIAKIIDYGRCYFNDKQNDNKHINNSKNVLTTLCNQCFKCGTLSGFRWLNKTLDPESYYISSQNPNASHDLRLLYELKRLDMQTGGQIILDRNLRDIIYKTKYGVGVSDNSNSGKRFGTKQPTLLRTAIQKTKKALSMNLKINTVRDAFSKILELLNTPDYIERNNLFYDKKTKLGELHIYGLEKPMEWKPELSNLKQPTPIGVTQRSDSTVYI